MELEQIIAGLEEQMARLDKTKKAFDLATASMCVQLHNLQREITDYQRKLEMENGFEILIDQVEEVGVSDLAA